jgi:hypothetical protein
VGDDRDAITIAEAATSGEGGLAGALRLAHRVIFLLVIPNDVPSGIDTSSAAPADRKLHLNLTKTARSVIDGATNLAISNPVTNADVHDEAATCFGRYRMPETMCPR